MNRVALSLDRFLDARAAGDINYVESVHEPVHEICDAIQLRANQILPSSGFSASLRMKLFDEELQRTSISSSEPGSLEQFGHHAATSLFRRACEIAALITLLTVGVFAFVQWTTGNSELPRSNMGSSLSLPAATIAVDESTDRLPTVEYDLTRIGAVLKVDIQVAQLRATPSFDGAVLRQLESGEQVVAIGAGFGTPSEPFFFLNVETNDSLRGWIWFGAVTLTEEEIATQNAFTPTPGVPVGVIEQVTLTQTTGSAFLVDTQLVVTKATRLRVEPGIDGYVVSALAIGDHLWSRGLQIETERETWIGVQYLGSGRTFWVAGSALESWTYPQGASVNDSDTPLETSNADSPKVIVIGNESPGKNDLVESIFEVVLRQEADFGSEAVSLIPAGTQLIVTGDVVRGDSNASWLPVLDLVTGNSGWVPLPWVQLVPAGKNLIRVGARLEVKLPYNVRTEPSFQSYSIAVLDPGELFVVIETDVANEDATWIRVRLANGEIGWLAIVADDPNLLFGTPVAGE